MSERNGAGAGVFHTFGAGYHAYAVRRSGKTLAVGNEQKALRQQYEKLQAAPAPGFAFDASQAVDNWSEIEMAYTQFTSTLTSELGD